MRDLRAGGILQEAKRYTQLRRTLVDWLVNRAMEEAVGVDLAGHGDLSSFSATHLPDGIVHDVPWAMTPPADDL